MRGDVYRLRAPKDADGHEQRVHRYCIVVQSNRLVLSTVLVAPTSTQAAPAMFRPEIEMDGVKTRVLVEQIRAVDHSRLGDFAGRLEIDEMADVDVAIRGIFGLIV